MDIDFAVTSGSDRHTIVRALSEVGFQQQGRIFAHPDTVYTLEVVIVGGSAITSHVPALYSVSPQYVWRQRRQLQPTTSR